MKSQGQVTLGIVLISAGVLAILDRWLGISLGRLFLPLLFVAFGVWIIVRPSRIDAGTRVAQHLFGDVVRRDVVGDEDILVVLGDVKIDWRSSEWPEAPVTVRVSGLLGDVRVKVPEDVGVMLTFRGLGGSLRLDDRKQDTFFTTAQLSSDGYERAVAKLDLDVTYLLGDVRVERDPAAS